MTFESLTDTDLLNAITVEEAPAVANEELSNVEAQEAEQQETSGEVESEDSEQVEEAVASGEEEESQEEAEVSEEEAAKEEVAVQAMIKFLTSAEGDEGVEVPESAMLKLTADNKEELVSLAELKKNYSGKVAWDKRFNELNKQKQDFENKSQKPIESFVKEFVDASQTGPYAAISVIAKFAGKDPVEFTNAFRAAARAEAMKYLELDERGRDLQDKTDELNLKKLQYDLKDKEKQDQAKLEELQLGIKKQTEELGITVDEFVDGLNGLKEVLPEGEINSITPEQVGTWIRLNKRADVVEAALTEINPDLASDDKLVAFLTKRSVDDNLDENTTIEKIKSYYGKKQPDPSVKKVNVKMKPKVQPKAQELKGSVKTEKEVYTFADLDELLK